MPDTVIKLASADEPEKWQSILADLVTEPKELLQILGLDARQLPVPDAVLKAFPLKVPRPYISRMERGNPRDPLLLQVLPLSSEAQTHTGPTDPLAESRSNPLPGLLQKYHGRVLLTVAPHCAVHCRYCFRRDFDYAGNTPGRGQWQAVLDYIKADPSITEVIFSGGDPLAANDRYLAWLSAEIAAIAHVQRLRIHSRTPIVIPQRVTPALQQWLGNSRLQMVLVLHCNHARELDDQVARAVELLAATGATLLNQSVLLRGVNDDAAVLQSLSEKLFSLNVLPYYLHLLDPVPGVGHFDVPETEARALMATLRARLPGYLVPQLVREVAGATSKSPIV